MLEFANFISIIPLYYYIILAVIAPILFFNNIYYLIKLLIYAAGIIITALIHKYFKLYVQPPNILKNYWYRPKGAKGCDFQSLKGYTPDFTPGFPSGHMAATLYVSTVNILFSKKIKNKKLRRFFRCINILIIPFMGWARYYKSCHNIIQIIAGSILGTFCGIIFYYLMIFNNDKHNN